MTPNNIFTKLFSDLTSQLINHKVLLTDFYVQCRFSKSILVVFATLLQSFSDLQLGFAHQKYSNIEYYTEDVFSELFHQHRTCIEHTLRKMTASLDLTKSTYISSFTPSCPFSQFSHSILTQSIESISQVNKIVTSVVSNMESMESLT